MSQPEDTTPAANLPDLLARTPLGELGSAIMEISDGDGYNDYLQVPLGNGWYVVVARGDAARRVHYALDRADAKQVWARKRRAERAETEQ